MVLHLQCRSTCLQWQLTHFHSHSHSLPSMDCSFWQYNYDSGFSKCHFILKNSRWRTTEQNRKPQHYLCFNNHSCWDFVFYKHHSQQNWSLYCGSQREYWSRRSQQTRLCWKLFAFITRLRRLVRSWRCPAKRYQCLKNQFIESHQQKKRSMGAWLL